MIQNGMTVAGRRSTTETQLMQGGVLTAQATFTSADARNTFDADGLLVVGGAGVNVPRTTYVPSGGVLIPVFWVDGQATNSLIQNRTLTGWTVNGAVQDAVGIDGVATKAWTFTGTNDASLAITVTNNSQTHRATALLKKAGGSAIFSVAYTGGTGLTYTATVDTTTGIATASGDAVAANVSIADAGNWWWVQIAAANNTTGNTTLTYKLDVSSGTFIYDFGGVYLNQTAPFHPFETGAAAITVAAENASVPLGSWFKQGQGSLYVEFYLPTVTSWTVRELLVFDKGTSAIQIRIEESGQIRTYIQVSGVTESELIGPTLTAGRHIAMLTYEDNNAALYVDGTQEATDVTTFSVPTNLERLTIGSFQNNSLYGYLGMHAANYRQQVEGQATAESRTAL